MQPRKSTFSGEQKCFISSCFIFQVSWKSTLSCRGFIGWRFLCSINICWVSFPEPVNIYIENEFLIILFSTLIQGIQKWFWNLFSLSFYTFEKSPLTYFWRHIALRIFYFLTPQATLWLSIFELFQPDFLIPLLVIIFSLQSSKQ